MKAQCQCGQLAAELPDVTPRVIACHCTFCQRRSGAPVAAMAYYPVDKVAIIGEATGFARPTETGGVFETFFCPRCGSTIYAKASLHPTIIGVAIGAIGTRGLPPPALSVWEENRPDWLVITGDVRHFEQGTG